MNRTFFRAGLLMLLVATALPARAIDPRTTLDAGVEAYRAKQFDVAQKKFFEASTNAVTQQLDPAVAKYNEAAAQYRMGRVDEAAERFAEALRTGNLPLQQRAWYNRGDALLGRMALQEKQGKLDEAKKLAEEAATHFEQAVLLDPDDADAKVNYELCLQLQQELEKKKQEQEKQQQQQKQDKQDKDKDKDKEKKEQQDKQNQQQQKPDDDKQKQDQKSKPDQDQKQQEQQSAQGEKKDNEMTPDEALQLLNAMRQEEQAHRDKLRLNIGQPEPVEKDW